MAKQTVNRTALGAAVCRMIEQYQPEKHRLFADPLAQELVGGLIKWLMQFPGMRSLTVQQTDAVAAGIYGAQVCRTRYIDEAVQAAVAGGVDQLVILGAGYDTRPYRLPRLEAVRVFEVDLPAVQEDKKKKLQKYLGRLPERVTYLPIDFDTQSLEAAFAGSGFDPGRPAFFLWEGVTQYISEDAVRRTLAFVGQSAPGSGLVFTYVLKSIIERRSDIPGIDHMLEVVGKQSPWIFGLEPAGLQEFLRPFHLSLAAEVGAADYQEKYLSPIGRRLDVFAGERIAQAVVG